MSPDRLLLFVVGIVAISLAMLAVMVAAYRRDKREAQRR